jgi:hypothetical protein
LILKDVVQPVAVFRKAELSAAIPAAQLHAGSGSPEIELAAAIPAIHLGEAQCLDRDSPIRL